MRTWAILGILAALAVSQQVLRTNLTISGAKAGTTEYVETDEGACTSKTTIDVQGVHIYSDVAIKWDGSKIATMKSHVDFGSRSSDLTIDGKTAKVTPKGQKETTVPMPEYEAVFSNFHPQLAASVWRAVQAKGGKATTIKALFLESLTPVDLEVKPGKDVTIQVGSATQTVHRMEINIAGVALTTYVDGAGRVVGVLVPAQNAEFITEGYEGLFTDPIAKFPELSQNEFGTTTVKAEKEPMRDAVALVSDRCMPDKPGRYPTILVRTPYTRAGEMAQAVWWAKRGYVYMAQDCRGRGDSDGDWDPFVNERRDGADTVDWIAKQPWSNGKVGMIGGSYVGYVQWAAAVEHPFALKCIVPEVSPPDAMLNVPYDHGTFLLMGGVWWASLVSTKSLDLSTVVMPRPADAPKFTGLPLSTIDKAATGKTIPFFQAWLKRETSGQWKGYDTTKGAATVKIPVLAISGWWDGDEIGTQTYWRLRRSAGYRNQWLIYGPWEHGFDLKTKVADQDYGPNSVIDLKPILLRFFDTCLKSKSVHWDKQPHVEAFLTVANTWMHLSDWPDASRGKPAKLYLSSDWAAKPIKGAKPTSLNTAQSLVASPPASNPATAYTYDPMDIKLELAETKATAAPDHQENPIVRLVGHKDAKWFFSAPFAKDTGVAGPASVDLWVKADVKDTDFYAFLMDLDEKGDARLICQPGKLRMSYRDGFDKRRPMIPGQVYHISLELWDTARLIQKGHRLGVIVASKMWPAYARNLNTMDPVATATKSVVAHIKILHDKAHPSSVSFWKYEP